MVLIRQAPDFALLFLGGKPAFTEGGAQHPGLVTVAPGGSVVAFLAALPAGGQPLPAPAVDFTPHHGWSGRE